MTKQLLLAAFIFQLFACSNTSNSGQPVLSPSAISKDMMSWLYYDRDYMQWSADFKALDTSAQPMERKEFLHRLTTGNYLPVKIKTDDSSLCYQLYRIESKVDGGIRDIIRNQAQTTYRYVQYEGSSLPGFNYVDLDGNTYDAQTTKGKVVVLNCWYIGCQACKEEMPELNKIVKQLENKKDIVFIGLAFDKADSLRKFLTKMEFNYAIVPEKENYVRNDLGIVAYPTHIIINKEGKIVKVIEGKKINEVINVLNKELTKG